jgi:hypothetical protein
MVSSGNFVSLYQVLGRSGGGRHAYWVCRTDLLYGVLVISFSSLHLLFGPGQQGRREGLERGFKPQWRAQQKPWREQERG